MEAEPPTTAAAPHQHRPPPSEALAGPAVGLPGPQMTYAAARSSRSSADTPGFVAATPAPPPPADQPATPARGPPPAPLPAEEGEEPLPPPPQPPIVLPSSAAAVRVKEQQLGIGPNSRPAAAPRDEEEEEDEEAADDLDAAAHAALAVEQQQEGGPGLLQRAMDAASGLAAGVAAAAAPVVQAAVDLAAGGGEEAAEAEAPRIGTTSPMPPPHTATVAAPPIALPTAPLPARPALPAAPVASSRVPAAQQASAAATAARVLPASAAVPASTGQGYFPTAGTAVTVAKPAPRPSELEARHVVAERLTALREVQAREPAAPAAATVGGSAAAGGRPAGMGEDWISELVERVWPYAKAAIEQMAWEQLPAILEASEPSWIHDINLQRFQLGDKEPDLSNIRVWTDASSLMDDAFVEVDFEWRSKQDVELSIEVLPSSMDKAWIPNFVEQQLKDALAFQVGVEKAMLKGRLRLTLRPLLKRVPVVGAVQISFVEQPEIDFDLTLGGSTDVPLEPALKSWIKTTLQDMVFATFTSPEHYFLQIDPEAQDIERPVGVLVLKVVEATRVPRLDFLSKSQPFVELWVRASQKRCTAVEGSTKHARWGETFELPVHVKEHQELRMALYDYDWASANDEIGRCQVALSELPSGQMRDLWLDVTSESQEELAGKKKELSKQGRAAVAAAKPLRGQSTKGCRLHVQATLLEFSQEEQRLVVEGHRRPGGMAEMLGTPEGQRLSPHLRRLLVSGLLSVKVVRADDLGVSGLLGRPTVKGTVRVGGEAKELPVVKASKRGGACWETPVELPLGADATQNQGSAVVVELSTSGLFGGSQLGHARVPLGDAMKAGHLHDSFPLLEGNQQGGGGRVELELIWRSYF